MNKDYHISLNRANKRYKRRVKSRLKQKNRRIREQHQAQLYNRLSHTAEKELNGDFSLENVIQQWMPENIINLISNENSQFRTANLYKAAQNADGNFLVPPIFSIVENPGASYKFIREVFGALLFQTHREIVMDYSLCQRVDLGAQVLLDIIQLDIISFFKKCRRHKKTSPKVIGIGGRNVKKEDISKMLFSVGSPAIHNDDQRDFPDIIPYKLCVYERPPDLDSTEASRQKDIDTTTLVDYVLDCLSRMGKHLTPERLDDLCTVISEILINAEEHSSNQKRFSIGYFQETNGTDEHYGVFRLAILNFGDNIYSKFKDPDCPNKDIIKNMKQLSKDYTSKGFFKWKKFEEETLWTLYSLQEGVTTVSKKLYKKRGNGSIRFIESFFNLKGSQTVDEISKMAILSGNTSIIFDGKYGIVDKYNDKDEKFQVMTFNESGNIADLPDKEFVKFVKEDFPGTMISARILFNEDDFKYEIES